MYESPITRLTADIMGNIVKREEGYLVESVHKVGFDIDKEELAKALRYDRDQYEKGFNDGRLFSQFSQPRWIPCSEKLPDFGISVLLNEGYSYAVGYLLKTTEGKYEWCVNGWYNVLEDWSAWMSLPEPWKGDANDK